MWGAEEENERRGLDPLPAQASLMPGNSRCYAVLWGASSP